MEPHLRFPVQNTQPVENIKYLPARQSRARRYETFSCDSHGSAEIGETRCYNHRRTAGLTSDWSDRSDKSDKSDRSDKSDCAEDSFRTSNESAGMVKSPEHGRHNRDACNDHNDSRDIRSSPTHRPDRPQIVKPDANQ